jgi:hypothetical protein
MSIKRNRTNYQGADKINASIKFKFILDPDKYEIIKEEKIENDNDNDNLYTGIYKSDIFKEPIYIVCCNRYIMNEWVTLDYTRLSQNEENANIQYEKMIIEIEKDASHGE